MIFRYSLLCFSNPPLFSFSFWGLQSEVFRILLGKSFQQQYSCSNHIWSSSFSGAKADFFIALEKRKLDLELASAQREFGDLGLLCIACYLMQLSYITYYKRQALLFVRQPSHRPSSQPSTQPTSQPCRRPSSRPSTQPTPEPSRRPSSRPSTRPSSQPFRRPSSQPSSAYD